MLLGVVLHCAFSLAPSTFDLFGKDSAAHPAFDLLLEAIHGFRMELFFLLCGYSSHALSARDGDGGLIGQRVRRIFAPLLAGCGLLVPILAFFRWLRAPDAPLALDLQPMHLWFLYYLLLLEGAWVIARRVTPARVGRWISTRVRALQPSPAIIASLSVLTALLLSRNPRWQYFDFRPVIVWLLHFGIFFAFGWALFARKEALRRIAADRHRHLVAAAVFFTGFAVALHLPGILPAWTVPAFNAGYAWTMALGLCGYALATFDHPPHPKVRALSEASYWIYLSHWPIATGLQIALLALPAPSGLKFIALLATVLGLSFWSYRRFVEGRAIGAFLRGEGPLVHRAMLRSRPSDTPAVR